MENYVKTFPKQSIVFSKLDEIFDIKSTQKEKRQKLKTCIGIILKKDCAKSQRKKMWREFRKVKTGYGQMIQKCISSHKDWE